VPDIVLTQSASLTLDPAPIDASWILADQPEATCTIVARSQDRTSFVAVWECTPGRFNWHYVEDETVVLLEGEVFITDHSGRERRLGPGDTGFFPAGTSCMWRITERVRKVAVMRRALPLPVSFGLRVWNKLLRMAQPRRLSPI